MNLSLSKMNLWIVIPITLSAIIIIIFIRCSSGPSTPQVKEEKKTHCGYESCHPLKEGMINVHIVPHTHNDVGWMKTTDQYYYGSKNRLQNARVQYILDSVTDALEKDPNRRFIYVEVAYFWKWWMEKPSSIRQKFKHFIDNGQLEFIGGGWCMNDEAATNYQSIIDQFTWGLRQLNDTFGECGRPKIGWQIDPYGHSREMASIFAQLGYDGLLLGRIDYQEKQSRYSTKTAEFVWKSRENSGIAANLFTGVMFNIYRPPPGFCFDILCMDEPIVDDKDSPEYNVDQRVDEFLEYVKNMAKNYANHNLILTMGGDFQYMVAETWFRNLDLLIRYANRRQGNGSEFNLIYSTPSCYIKAVHDDADKNERKWQLKSDDFLPHATNAHAYWSGFFTSRPTVKRFERIGNNYLQVCKQLYAIADMGPDELVDLNSLRQAMGLMQHHDAIAGTGMQIPTYDYSRLLNDGIEKCEKVTEAALNKLVNKQSSQQFPNLSFSSCLLNNISSCPITEDSQNFVATIYNPLSSPVTHFVRFPVLGRAYAVRDSEGNEVTSQMIPIQKEVLTTPGRQSKATADLIFRASDIPPLGFKSYYIESKPGDDLTQPSSNNIHERQKKLYDTITDLNQGIQITMDDSTGLIASVTMNNVTILLSQEFLYYEGFVFDNKLFASKSSGSYIFRPKYNEATKVSSKVEYIVYEGDLVTEIHQTFNEWASQIIRLYEGESFIEFQWLVGPLPVSDPIGKEIISRFSTNLITNSTFYTDSNGRQLMKRILNWRPAYNINLMEPVSGNYYSVTSRILIRDISKNVELAVLTDRSQGGSSLRDGEIELMVHRKCIYDAEFLEQDEALNETAFGKGLVARGSHYLILGEISSENSRGDPLAAYERNLAQKKLLQAWTFFSPTEGLTFDEYSNKYAMNFSALDMSLPKYIHILSLEPWKNNSLLLRLESILDKNEDPEISGATVVNLKGLFHPFEITSIRETTLGANQWLSENERLKFASIDEDSEEYNSGYSSKDAEVSDMIVELNPMQIRTFIIEVDKRT